MKQLLLILAVLFAAAAARAEDRILWYSIGDNPGNTANMDAALAFAQANNFNAICILSRYRADAMYIPNRDYNVYANPEPRRYPSVDSTQYIIDRAHERGMRVYAAVSCFIVSDGASNPFPSHMNSSWRTHIYVGDSNTYAPLSGYPRAMTLSDSTEGYWVDPGHPDVQHYTRQVILDFIQNYDVDGIFLDRIRYPGDAFPRGNGAYGYHPSALAAYNITNPAPSSSAFINVRRQAITDFISNTQIAVHQIKPWIIYGAVPIIYGSALTDTYSYVYQYFPYWDQANNPFHVSGKGALDLNSPQYYRTAPATNATLMNLVNNDIGETTNMFHQATFSASSLSGSNMAINICDTRSRNMNGWGIFSYNAAKQAGYMSALRAASTSCGTDVLASASPLAQFTLKTGWDGIAPNAPQSVLATVTATKSVRITWNPPAPATDGDTASHYLIYRSATSPVKLYYENLLTRRSLTEPLTATTFEDVAPLSGNAYYAVVAVDEYNNKSAAATTNAVNVGTLEYIVETRSGGKNFANYSEISGNWADSSSKSTALGTTGGIGSRYATLAAKDDVARFAPNLTSISPAENEYEIFITTNAFGSTNSTNTRYRVNTSTGIVQGTFDMGPGTTGNTWYSLGTYKLNATGSYLEIDSSTSTTSDGTARIVADAVRFILRPGVEPEPTVQLHGWSIK